MIWRISDSISWEDLAVLDRALQACWAVIVVMGLSQLSFQAAAGGLAPQSRKFFSWRVAALGEDGLGWNCTPTSSVRWRTPMISPSSVHAVTSRQSAGWRFSMASEW